MKTREQDEIRLEHERLRRVYEEAREDQSWWEITLKDRRMKKVLESIQEEEKTKKEGLVDCEKKDVDSLQASVKANRGLILKINRESDPQNVSDAKRALDEYEQENALFLSQEEDSAKTA